MVDPYATLGILRTATVDEIKSAYRRLAKKYHPDTGTGGDAEKFREVKAAYDVLSDPIKKQEYDGPIFKADDLAENLWRHFNTADDLRKKANAYATWEFRQETARGANIYYQLVITFEEMCQGCTKEFTVTRRVVCPECKGEGGSDPMPCEFCDGNGKTSDYLHAECGVCNGRGKVPRKTCLKCAGSGLAPKEQRVKLTLPAGIQPNGSCDLEGYGQEALNGAPGNLVVNIQAREHEFFRRSGFDINCTLKVNAIRAILGGEITIPTIHGARVFTIPPGTQDGHHAVLEGEGIHANDKKGNQNVRIRIVIPVLNKDEKEVLTEMLIDKIVKHSPEAELEPLKEALRW